MKSKMVSFCTVLAVTAVVLVFASCPTDKAADEIPVTGISLNKSSLTLAVGDSEKLTYTITPANAANKQVRWSSDKPNFATVSNGMVTAAAVGTAVITVKTVNGNHTASATVTVVPVVPVSGISLEKSSVTLTIFNKEKINYTITPDNATNKNVTWSSSNTNVATVASDGTITAVGFTSGGSNKFNTGGTSTSPTTSPATGTATITATTASGGHTAIITVNTTTAPQVNLSALPPLKTQFADYFLIGNIFRGSSEISGSGASATISNAQLTRHFNALTAENAMKPSYLVNGYNAGTNTVTWNTNNKNAAVNFVNAARNANMKVIGHTLLWHSQNANWMTNIGTDRNTALTAMKTYITAVMGDPEFKGKIYSWDVLNEIFPDGVSAAADWKNVMRTTGDSQAPNPWYVAIGSDFVYEGFLAARLADPAAILYYNDYNMDSVGKATMVRNMVRDVNVRYKTAYPNETRLLIEGIGMQSHHNHSVTAAQIRASIEGLFKPLGVKLSVSELDILAYPTYSAYSSALSAAGGVGSTNRNHESTVTNDWLKTQAQRYGEYMQVYLDNADIIERVSLWGVTDNISWRSFGLPLLFDPNGGAKPAYYQFVGALPQ